MVLDIRGIRHSDSGGPKQHERITKMRNFLSHTRWVTSQEDARGITWLELFVWYRMHDAAEGDREPLGPKELVEKELAVFKEAARQLTTKCLSVNQE